MDRTQAMVRDIKEQVLLELEQSESYPDSTYGKGFQAYRQLVDAVREEVLFDLKNRSPAAPPDGQTRGQRLSAAEMDLIKQQVINELRRELRE